MKKQATLTIILALILAFVVSLATTLVFRPNEVEKTRSVESDLERILKTGKMRCAYVINPPASFIEPNSGELQGIYIEAMQTIGTKLSIEIEWTEEVGFGSMIAGLLAGRYDIVPSAIWPTAARGREADFTIPLYYSGVCAYVRADDDRFTDNLEAINSPNIKIATIDGEMAEAIASSDFPNAQQVSLPQLSEIPVMLLNLKQSKADVTFVELFFAYEFLEKNPGSIKNITPNNPIRVFPNTILLRRDQPGLKALLNIALEEILNLGLIDKLIKKYEPYPGTFYQVALPYRTSN